MITLRSFARQRQREGQLLSDRLFIGGRKKKKSNRWLESHMRMAPRNLPFKGPVTQRSSSYSCSLVTEPSSAAVCGAACWTALQEAEFQSFSRVLEHSLYMHAGMTETRHDYVLVATLEGVGHLSSAFSKLECRNIATCTSGVEC